MKRIFGFKRSIALLLTICLFWVPNAALAATAKASVANTLTEEQMHLVDKAKEFTQYTETGVVFDQKGAQKAGLPASFVKEMEALYQRMNDKASDEGFQWGELLKSIEARKVNPVQVTPGVSESGDVAPQWSSRSTWMYYQLTLTEWETQLIINAMWSGAGAAGVYAALTSLGIVTLPYAGIVGLVAALLAFGAGWMGFVDTLGHNQGVYFRLYYTGSILMWHN